MAIMRADDEIIIPGYDFYNHRNGKWRNADTEINPDISHETRATRRIAPGEKVYISYNQCKHCGGRADGGYGTAEMLRDYGFVENLPQRWHYYNYNEIAFDLHCVEGNGSDSDVFYEVLWVTEPTYLKDEIRNWLHRELRRLHRLWFTEYIHGEKDEAVSDFEWQETWRFAEANIVAMSAAIHALDGINRIPTKTPEMDLHTLYSDLDDDLWTEFDFYEQPHCNLQHFDNYPLEYSFSSFLQDMDIKGQQEDLCFVIGSHIQLCSSKRLITNGNFSPLHYSPPPLASDTMKKSLFSDPDAVAQLCAFDVFCRGPAGMRPPAEIASFVYTMNFQDIFAVQMAEENVEELNQEAQEEEEECEEGGQDDDDDDDDDNDDEEDGDEEDPDGEHSAGENGDDEAAKLDHDDHYNDSNGVTSDKLQ